MPDYLRKYAPGDRVTYAASAAITGGQLVTISGNGTVSPTSGGADEVEGVATRDAATGQLVTVVSGGIPPLTASAAIGAGGRVMPAASGAVQPYGPVAPATVPDPAHIIGHATEAIAAGAVGRVRLYH